MFINAAKLTDELQVKLSGEARLLRSAAACLCWRPSQLCLEAPPAAAPPCPHACSPASPPPLPASDQQDTGASVYRLVRSAGSDAAAAKLRIHHSSVFFRCRPQWVCFFSAEQHDTGW